MKIIDNRGFTLVELLVAIVLFGLITSLSIPVIRNIQNGNENKKYETYASTLLSSAKLYNDSYGIDLFDPDTDGCVYISLNKLIEKRLIKDISIDGVSCISDNTFVKVEKKGDKYTYEVFMKCGYGSTITYKQGDEEEAQKHDQCPWNGYE